MQLSDMKKSISAMSHEEAVALHLAVRQSRRVPKQTAKKKTAAKREAKKKDPTVLVKSMTSVEQDATIAMIEKRLKERRISS